MFCSIIIQGPPGPPGAAGAPGPPGAPGAAGRLLGDEIDEFGNDFDSINVESVKNGSALSTDYNYVNPLSPVIFFVILISILMMVKSHVGMYDFFFCSDYEQFDSTCCIRAGEKAHTSVEKTGRD